MSIYTQERFIFMTLDPVHIGTGGYRLGRVDMSIMREPGTNLPKIPGTSLSGAARSYAHLSLCGTAEDKEIKKNGPVASTDTSYQAFYYTFGSANNAGGGQAGTVSIGDARLLFFPISSQSGPVWITTAEILHEVWGITIKPTDETVITTFVPHQNHINLGWLLLSARKHSSDIAPKTSPANWGTIKDRIVVVSPKSMTQLVNSNLEVRTSVSIDPETGAAQDGALFTYEALPRATWLWCDIIEDNYKGSFTPLPDKPNIQSPLDVVRAGLELIEYLGVGGMGTRGFGRMKRMSTFTPVEETK